MGKERRTARLYMQRPWGKKKQISGNTKTGKNAFLPQAQKEELSWGGKQSFLYHNKNAGL